MRIEVRDQDAAADLIDALRGQPPATKALARRRARLADELARALFIDLLNKPTDHRSQT